MPLCRIFGFWMFLRCQRVSQHDSLQFIKFTRNFTILAGPSKQVFFQFWRKQDYN
jgi:hypothetical protein